MSRDHVAPVPIVIAGHSHCRCLGVPDKTDDEASRIVPNAAGDARYEGFAGAWPLPDDFFAGLARLAKGRTIALAWKGNRHVTNFMLVAGPCIDFVLREEPDLPIDPDAVLVSDHAIDTRLASARAGLEPVIGALRASGAARVLVLGTPPPKGDIAIRQRRPGPDTRNFKSIAEHLGLDWARLTLASPAFMYKAWRVVQRHLQVAASRAGAEFVPTPDTALDGLVLRPKYAADDWTHGNEAYGQLMRDHLYEHASKAKP